MKKRLGLSIDFGGTTIKCAIMDQDGNNILNYSFDTVYGDIYKNLDNIYDTYKDIINKNEIDDLLVESYSIGVPGPVIDKKVQYLINVGINEQIDILEYLNKLFNKNGYIVNDAEASGIGEFEIRNTPWDKVLIMLGTGTGIYTKYGNEELGHVIILDYDEERYDNKGVLNSIESYCSQIGILKTYKNYCEKYNIKYEELTIKEIFNKDNKAKIDTVEDFLNKHLVDGIIGIINRYKDTKEIIIGGGISNGIDISLLEKEVNKKTNKNIIISKAKFTNGLYGLNRIIFKNEYKVVNK